MKKKSSWDAILRLENPDQMFDLVIASVYICAQFGRPMPVDEAREVFIKIKKILAATTKL